MIDSYTFSNNKLKEVVIPESVVEIRKHAFSNNNLVSVTIPEYVEDIGKNAFAGNDNIETITILGDVSRFNYEWELIGFPKHLMPSNDE